MVKPLRARTMGLSELQLATLDLIRKVRFQLNRLAHEDGMSDSEFLDQIVDKLEHHILQDRVVLRMNRKRKEDIPADQKPAKKTRKKKGEVE